MMKRKRRSTKFELALIQVSAVAEMARHIHPDEAFFCGAPEAAHAILDRVKPVREWLLAVEEWAACRIASVPAVESARRDLRQQLIPIGFEARVCCLERRGRAIRMQARLEPGIESAICA